MTTFSELKEKQLSARKRKKATHTKVLTTLIGDLETVSKATGKEVTDKEVNAMVKRFLKSANEYLALTISDEKRADLEAEKALLETLMPKPATKKELKEIISYYISSVPNPSMGAVMSYLRGRLQGNYDGKMASDLVTEMLSEKSKK